MPALRDVPYGTRVRLLEYPDRGPGVVVESIFNMARRRVRHDRPLTTGFPTADATMLMRHGHFDGYWSGTPVEILASPAQLPDDNTPDD